MISVGDILIAIGLFVLGLYLPYRVVRAANAASKTGKSS
jgi:hypothetical protein